MKKILTKAVILLIFAAFLICLAGCREHDITDSVTMKKIIDASGQKNILETYNSYLIAIERPDIGYTEQKYYEKDIAVFKNSNTDEILLYSDNKLAYIKTGGVDYSVMFADCEPYTFVKDDNALFTDVSLKEKIVSAVENENTVTVVSELYGENARLHLLSVGIEYAEGDRVKIEYELKKDNYLFAASRETLISKGGKETLFLKRTAKYNPLMPTEFIPLYTLATREGETRTVSATVHPGTTEEKTFSAEVKKGIDVKIISSDNYKSTLYSDPERTVPVTELDKEGDVTVYLKIAPYFTVAEIIEAQSHKTLISKYSSYSTEIKHQNKSNMSYFFDAVYYVEHGERSDLYTKDGGWYASVEGEKYAVLDLHDESHDFHRDPDGAHIIDRMIIDTWEIVDGKLHLVCELTAEDSELYSAYYSDEYPDYVHSEGEIFKFRYILDAVSYTPEHLNVYTVHEGRETFFEERSFEYGVAISERGKALYKIATETKDFVTVTAIFTPDEDGEHIHVFSVPRGMKVMITNSEITKIYSDEDRTVECEINTDEDFVCYIK